MSLSVVERGLSLAWHQRISTSIEKLLAETVLSHPRLSPQSGRRPILSLCPPTNLGLAPVRDPDVGPTTSDRKTHSLRICVASSSDTKQRAWMESSTSALQTIH